MALTAVAASVAYRRILLSIVAVAVLAVTVAVQVPWYYFGRPADVGEHVDIRVLSSNLRKGRADAPSFVELAKANADVITVSELTPEEVERFAQAGIAEAFPYSILTPAADAGGIGLYSRFPVATSPTTNNRATLARGAVAHPRRALRPAGGQRARHLPRRVRHGFIRHRGAPASSPPRRSWTTSPRPGVRRR